MSLIAARELAIDATFVARVRAACVRAAVAVTGEGAGAANHAARADLARQVLRSPGAWAERFAEAAATNATLLTYATVGEMPDGDIEYTINSLWDAFAGGEAA